MKKIALLCILLTGVLLSACEGTDGRDGRDGDNIGTFYRSVSIAWDQWEEEEDATGPYLYYTVNEPQLTNYVINNAIMETYYSYRLSNNDNIRYVPLSYSDFWADKEEYFTVEYTLGQVTIIYKNSNASLGPELNAPYDFDIRVIWPY